MKHSLRAISLALVTLVVGACGSAAMTASPRPLRAASFDEYAVAFCSAFDSMFRAIGNPDTGEDSPMSADLDAAIEAGDVEIGRASCRERVLDHV